MMAWNEIDKVKNQNKQLQKILIKFNTQLSSPITQRNRPKQGYLTPTSKTKKTINELETKESPLKSSSTERSNITIEQLINIKSRHLEKFKKLKGENMWLNEKKAESPKKISEKLEEMRKKVQDLETQRENQHNLIQLIGNKDFFDKCVTEESFYQKIIGDRQRKETKELYKKLKVLEKEIKSNRIKSALQVKELKEYEEKLGVEKTLIQMKLLKTEQRGRLLEIIDTPKTTTSKSYTKIGYLYKPSINQLYN